MFSIELHEFFIYFGYQSLVKYVICKYFLSFCTLLCGCGGGLVAQSCPTLTFCSFLCCAEAFCLMTSLCSQMTWVNCWRFCAPFLTANGRREGGAVAGRLRRCWRRWSFSISDLLTWGKTSPLRRQWFCRCWVTWRRVCMEGTQMTFTPAKHQVPENQQKGSTGGLE